jgi:hypothetical protein
MPVPTHFKFTFRGHFEGSPEFWSFGLHFKRDVGGSGDGTLSNISESAVTSAYATFASNAFFGTVTRLDDWRAYQIGTDGRAETAPLIHTVPVGTPIGGAGGQNYPPQIAVVVTKVAANPGPAHLGRFYLPCLAMPISTGGRISTTDAQSLLTATRTFVNAVSNAIDLPFTTDKATLYNISNRGGSTGTKQTVKNLRVGRAFDTLRSRRRSMDEAYESGADL